MPIKPKTNSQRNRESSPFKDFYDKQEKFRKQEYDKTRENSSKRGYGGRWQQARAGYLAKHPLCVDCLKKGITKEASEVHHTIKHNGDWSIFWDSSLWVGLCKSCHSKRTAKGE